MDLNKEKAVLDKKIEDLKLNNIDGRINFAVKSYGGMRTRIKEIELAKEASAKEVSLKEALVNNPELQARILAKEFVLNKGPLDEQKADLAAAEAKNTQEIEARNKQTEDELREQCLNCKAVASNNIELCKEIQDKNRLSECRKVLMILELFNELNENKQVTNAALHTCKEVLSDELGENLDDKCKIICNAYLTKDPASLINYFKGEDGALVVAIFSGDTKYCNFGSDKKNKQEVCLSNAGFFSAIRLNNKELCSRINNPNVRTNCEAYFEKDEEKCEDFFDLELPKRREPIEK